MENKNIDIKKVAKVIGVVLLVCIAWQIIAPIIGLGVHIITSIIWLVLKIAAVALVVLLGIKLVEYIKNQG